MKKRVYVFINGILNNPGDSKGWPDRACTWINSKTDYKAEKFEYFCTAILKQLWQEKRTQNLADVIFPYQFKNFEIILVGHSNGCDIICRLLREVDIDIKEIHLFAAATNEDCRKNGINDAIADGRLEGVDYYCSENDDVLGDGNNAILRPIYRFLGYGFLGCRGPKFENFRAKSSYHWINNYGHSDWFKPGLNFDKSMNMIMNTKATG